MRAARWPAFFAPALPMATVALTGLLVQVPTFARVLHLGPLHLTDWLVALGLAAAAMLVPLTANRR